MTSTFEEAIIKTLVYADIFDYPLRKEEIRKWMIKVKSQKSKVKNTIKKLKIIKRQNERFFLKGRENIVKLRKEREKYSQEKFRIARRVVFWLKFIPTVRFIGITGALAINNAKKEDDIDLFIITSKGLLWTTRLLTTLLIDILGIRRRPYDREVNNKICLNMFMDEDCLTISPKAQDLFSAHEVIQVKPLYNKDKTYEKFIIANWCVRKYLPNAISIKYQSVSRRTSIKHKQNSLLHCYIVILLNSAEIVLKKLQLWYMRKRQTTEVIRDGIIRFHPQDARVWVLRKYKKRLMRD